MAARENIKEGVIRFDPDDGIYTDHFPGYPVVPGSLIIHAFVELAGTVREIEEFRFRTFVIPESYHYRMELRAGGWNCTLLKDEQVMAKGKLRI